MSRTEGDRADAGGARAHRSQSKGPGATVKEIAEAVKVMPIGMHKIGLAFLFQWYAMFIYWQS
jgi:maltose/moltooligosaccharide transporter